MLRKTTVAIKKEHQKKVLERVQQRQRLGQKEDDMDQIELPIVYTDEISMEMEKIVRLSKLNASTNTRSNFIELRVPYYCDEYESNIRLKVDKMVDFEQQLTTMISHSKEWNCVYSDEYDIDRYERKCRDTFFSRFVSLNLFRDKKYKSLFVNGISISHDKVTLDSVLVLYSDKHLLTSGLEDLRALIVDIQHEMKDIQALYQHSQNMVYKLKPDGCLNGQDLYDWAVFKDQTEQWYRTHEGMEPFRYKITSSHIPFFSYNVMLCAVKDTSIPYKQHLFISSVLKYLIRQVFILNLKDTKFAQYHTPSKGLNGIYTRSFEENQKIAIHNNFYFMDDNVTQPRDFFGELLRVIARGESLYLVRTLARNEIIETLSGYGFDFNAFMKGPEEEYTKEERRQIWSDFKEMNPIVKFSIWKSQIEDKVQYVTTNLRRLISQQQKYDEWLKIARTLLDEDEKVQYCKDFYINDAFTNKLRETLDLIDLEVVPWDPLKDYFLMLFANLPHEKILMIIGEASSGKSSFCNAFMKAFPGLHGCQDKGLLGGALGRIIDPEMRSLYICDEAMHKNKDCIIDKFYFLSKNPDCIYAHSSPKNRAKDTLYMVTSANHSICGFDKLIEYHIQNCRNGKVEDLGSEESLIDQAKRRIEFLVLSGQGQNCNNSLLHKYNKYFGLIATITEDQMDASNFTKDKIEILTELRPFLYDYCWQVLILRTLNSAIVQFNKEEYRWDSLISKSGKTMANLFHDMSLNDFGTTINGDMVLEEEERKHLVTADDLDELTEEQSCDDLHEQYKGMLERHF